LQHLQKKHFQSKDFQENKKSAAELGKIIAERAKQKGITTVMMDRSGAIYHGNISVFADSARQGGLQF